MDRRTFIAGSLAAVATASLTAKDEDRWLELSMEFNRPIPEVGREIGGTLWVKSSDEILGLARFDGSSKDKDGMLCVGNGLKEQDVSWASYGEKTGTLVYVSFGSASPIVLFESVVRKFCVWGFNCTDPLKGWTAILEPTGRSMAVLR